MRPGVTTENATGKRLSRFDMDMVTYTSKYERLTAMQKRWQGAVLVLELIATKDARKLLADVAHGRGGAWLAPEAEAALKRLGQAYDWKTGCALDQRADDPVPKFDVLGALGFVRSPGRLGTRDPADNERQLRWLFGDEKEARSMVPHRVERRFGVRPVPFDGLEGTGVRFGFALCAGRYDRSRLAV